MLRILNLVFWASDKLVLDKKNIISCNTKNSKIIFVYTCRTNYFFSNILMYRIIRIS